MLTLDSSVIIASLKRDEEFHEECRKILERIKNDKEVAVEPYLVLIEISAAIKRRTSSTGLAEKIYRGIKGLQAVHFLEMESRRSSEASKIAMETGLRGMDAIVVQLAREFNSTLITLDDEIVQKAKSIVNIKTPKEYL